MARIRSVKPEFWADQKLARLLSRDARLLYIGLWNFADEHCRCMGDPRWIKGQVFPYDDDLTVERVAELLNELVRARRADMYKVENDSYIYLRKMAEHQRLEPHKVPSRLPAPEHDEHAADLHTQDGANESARDSDESALVRARSGSRLQGAGSREQVTNTRSPALRAGEPEFEAFWSAYPRKVGKARARKVWAHVTKATAAEIVLDGARRIAADPNLPEQQYIPHPTTWLSRAGWEDEPFPPRNRSPSTTDARVSVGSELVAKYQAEEESPQLLAIEGTAS